MMLEIAILLALIPFVILGSLVAVVALVHSVVVVFGPIVRVMINLVKKKRHE